MNEQEQKNLADLLKHSVPPVSRELHRDLWPQMQQRLDRHPEDQSWIAAMFSVARLSSVPWFDWALLAALIVGVCLFPNSIPVWLYHF
ncbi:MAG TPA: hypothetical protein VFE61_14470 [Candidatus Sulfotelmatobacter sp.]|jgi:hypothetical protein|nr:hypothetical protein [Candidatus Sulfotelmatobacter sp.]